MLPKIGNISSYLLFMVIGILSGILYYLFVRKRFSYRWYIALLLGFIMTLVEVFSAKIMFLIENPNSIKNGVSWTSGYSLFGAFFFAPLFLILISLLLKFNFLDLLDYLFPAGLLNVAFCRIGCMCAGCCYGIEVGWGITNGTVNGLFPVQPIEAGLDLGAFFLIHFLMTKDKLRRGEAFYITYISYGLIRFTMEFLRHRTNVVGILSASHFYALAILIFGTVMLIYSRTHKLKERDEASHL